MAGIVLIVTGLSEKNRVKLAEKLQLIGPDDEPEKDEEDEEEEELHRLSGVIPASPGLRHHGHWHGGRGHGGGAHHHRTGHIRPQCLCFDSRDAGTEHVEEALLRWAAQVRARWRVFDALRALHGRHVSVRRFAEHFHAFRVGGTDPHRPLNSADRIPAPL